MKRSTFVLLTIFVVTPCYAQSQQSQQPQSAATSAPKAAAPAAATPAPAGNMKGSLQIDAAGFKGSLNFDGNPMSLIQQALPAQPAAQAPQTVPMQQMPMQMPMQQMPMQMPMQQMPMQMPMQQMPMMMQQTPAQPAPAAAAPFTMPNINFGEAAKMIGKNFNLPIDPRLINQGQKLLQQVFSPPPATQPAPPQTAAGTTRAFELTPQLFEQLNALVKQSQFNLQMAQQAAYLASFGEENLRLQAALEAQKNANEARTAGEQAAAIAPGATGEGAEMINTIRQCAVQCQTFADQARASAQAGTEVSAPPSP